MDANLEALLPLAAFDDRLKILADGIRHASRKRRVLDETVDEAKARIVKADARLAELRKDENEHTKEIRRLEALRDQARTALAHGHGTPEVSQRQIERCDVLLDEHETAALEDMEAKDGVSEERTSALADLEAAENTRSERAPGLDAELVKLRAEKEGIEVERGSLVRALPFEIRESYEGLHASRGTALSALDGDACSTCQHVVPMRRRSDIRQGRLMSCDGCGRWLYTKAKAGPTT